RSVVASLWQIPDKPTQVFMHRFYDNLWNRKMSKLEALRAAQVWMLREGTRQPELMRGVKRVLPGETPVKEGGPLPPFYWAAASPRGAAAPEAGQTPPQDATAGGKRALLVGVTKYDHLPGNTHLAGPANDVRLMRRLLEQTYRFPSGAIVSLTEDEGRPDRR